MYTLRLRSRGIASPIVLLALAAAVGSALACAAGRRAGGTAVARKHPGGQLSPWAQRLLLGRPRHLTVPATGRRYRQALLGAEWVARDLRRADLHEADLRRGFLWRVNL